MTRKRVISKGMEIESGNVNFCFSYETRLKVWGHFVKALISFCCVAFFLPEMKYIGLNLLSCNDDQCLLGVTEIYIVFETDTKLLGQPLTVNDQYTGWV